MWKHFLLLLLFILGVTILSFAENGEIVKDVARENGVVSIKPCDLQFNISDQWEPAPKKVIQFPDNNGFMLGRMGLKDKKGEAVIPTISVLWNKITQAQMNTKIEGLNVDPLLVFVNDNRPDLHSPDYHLDGEFVWQDGILTLKYAMGFELSAMLKNRPSKIIVIYTINGDKNLGIKIFAEVPEELFLDIREELISILKSFTPTSSTAYGEKEVFRSKVNGISLIEVRDRTE